MMFGVPAAFASSSSSSASCSCKACSCKAKSGSFPEAWKRSENRNSAAGAAPLPPGDAANGFDSLARRLREEGLEIVAASRCRQPIRQNFMYRYICHRFHLPHHATVVCCLKRSGENARRFILVEFGNSGFNHVCFDDQTAFHNHCVTQNALIDWPEDFEDCPRSFSIVAKLSARFGDYDLLQNNCQHFAKTLMADLNRNVLPREGELLSKSGGFQIGIGGRFLNIVFHDAASMHN